MKRILLTYVAFAIAITVFGQAKKPTMMVVPSKTWCNEHGYIKTFTENGGSKMEPDYERAFLENGELKVAITVINDMMAAAGFEMKDMDMYLDRLSQTRAYDMAATSKTGADVAQSPLDIINAVAKSDYIFELYWKVNRLGPNKSVTYNLKGVDAYTSKQLAAASGTGPSASSAALAEQLQEAVVGTMRSFQDRLYNHFKDMSVKGREVALEIRVWNDCSYDLEEDLDGQELSQIIEDWVSENTVKGVYSVLDLTETRMEFEQVRIPLYDAGGRAIDTRRWAQGLISHLKTK